MRASAFFLVFFLFFSIITFSQEQPVVCKGRFRWDVKTLVDSSAADLVAMVPGEADFDTLSESRPPEKLGIFSGKDGHLPRFPGERQVVKIKAYIESVKDMGDRDFHIILKSTTSERHMVAEVPDPDCPQLQNYPVLKQKYALARRDALRVRQLIKDTRQPVLVEITGVPFWDARHWWLRGTSKTGIEIHPVLEIRLLEER